MTELTKEDGYVKVFKAMDEKYKDLKQDEMHKALREYFYNFEIKPSETYRNFLVRLDTAQRKLQQHEIQLPAKVQGGSSSGSLCSHGKADSTGKAADGAPGDEPRAAHVLEISDDEPRMNVLDLGKFRSKAPTFSTVYQTDKGYVAWCRAHINLKSAETMRRFRLYVEMRNEKKKQRIKEEIKKKEGVKIQPANVGMMAKKSFLQEKPETGESDNLEPDVKALMKMRRMLELYHQQGMCGAVKE